MARLRPGSASALLLAVALGGSGCGGSGPAGSRPAGSGPAGSGPAGSGPTAARAGTAPAHPSVFYDAHRFAVALRRARPARPAAGAAGVIVPHHWLAGHLIVQGLRDLAAGRALDRVVVLAPNHVGAGGAPVTTSDRPWATPQGRVEPDVATVAALARAGLAVVAPAVLSHEHALSGLMPVFAAELPGVRVVPLAVHGLSRVRAGALAGALAALLDGRTAIVASVDFSHYRAPEVAEVRDAETLRALRALDSAAIAGYGNDHLDSPGSIVTLVEVMRRAGATTFELREHANSAQLVGRPPGGTTSYIYGLYR